MCGELLKLAIFKLIALTSFSWFSVTMDGKINCILSLFSLSDSSI